MIKLCKMFLAMVEFLTRIPLGLGLVLDKQDFGRGLIFAPVVGLFIGVLLWIVYQGLLTILPFGLTVVMVMMFYVVVTGGLHLDGLGDTFDGIFSNRSKDQILDIMRDSRVGTNAVLAIVGLFLLEYAALSSLSTYWAGNTFLLMPVAGRMGSLIGAGLHTYARVGEGLGKSFVDFCGKKEILIGNFLVLPLFPVFFAKYAGILVLMSIFSAILISEYFSRKIGGVTGDILGAVCELNQLIFVITVVLCFH